MLSTPLRFDPSFCGIRKQDDGPSDVEIVDYH